MDEVLFFNEKKYLSSKAAGRKVGYTHDYVSRLASKGKVDGRLVGRTWYIDESAFEQFLTQHTRAKERWYEQLSLERQNTQGTQRYTPTFAEEIRTSLFSTLFFKQVVAFSIAFIFVFGTYYLHTAGMSLRNFAELVHPNQLLTPSSLVLDVGTKALLTVSDSLLQSYGYTLKTTGGTISSGYFLLAASTTSSGEKVSPQDVAAVALSDIPEVILRESKELAVGVYTTTQAKYITARDFILSLFRRSSTTIVVAPTTETSNSTTTTPSPVVIEGPRTIIERIIERTVQIPAARTDTLVSFADLDLRLEQLNNKLLSEIYKVSNTSASGIANNYNVISLTNNIDQLDAVTISNATLQGTLSGLTDAMVPDDLTLNGYLALSGGALTGAVTNSTTATSSFSGPLSVDVLNISTSTATSTAANGIELTDGCFSISGVCVTGSGSGIPGGSANQVQYNDGAAFAGSANFVFDGTNVGIGTSTPYSPLSVWNDALTAVGKTLFAVVDHASTTIFTIDDSGSFVSNASSTVIGDFTVVGNSTTTGLLEVGGTGTSTFADALDVTNEIDVGTAAGTSTVNGGLTILGSLRLSPLTNCDTIDTDGTGQMRCCSDEAGGSGSLTRGEALAEDTIGGTQYLQPTTTITIFANNGIVSNASSTFVSNVEVGGPLSASSTLAVNGIATFSSVLNGLPGAFTGGLTRQNETCTTDANGYLAPTSSITTLFNNGFVSTASSPIYGALNVEGHLGASSSVSIQGPLTVLSSSASSTVSGAFAVGTTSPLANALFTVGSTTGNEVYLVVDANSGFIGIGSSPPVTALSVAGALLVQNSAKSTFAGVLVVNDRWASQLQNCNTVDTDSSGNFICGTDSFTGSATEGITFENRDWQFTTIGGTDYIQPTTTTAIFARSGLVSNASSTFVSNVEVGGSLGASSTLAVDGVATFSSLLSGVTGAFTGGLTRQNETWSIDASGNLTTTTTLPVLIPGSLTVTQNLTRGNETLQLTAAADALTPTTSVGIITSASSTVNAALNVEGHLGASSSVSIQGPLTVLSSSASSTVSGAFAVGPTSPLDNALFTVGSTTGNEVYFIVDANSGFIGIGTSTPGTELAVAGTLLVQNSATSTFAGGLVVNDIRASQLQNCNTVDTDSSGNFICGTDSFTGSATEGITFENRDWQFTTIGGTDYIQPTSTVALFARSGLVSNASSTFVSNVEVGGSLGASSTLAVDGTATFSSLLSGLTGSFTGGLTRQNETWSIDASGNLTTTTTLPVLIPGSLTVTQNLTRGNETLQLTAAADALSPTTSVGLITSASSTVNAALNVEGHLGASSSVSIQGPLTFSSLLS